MSAWVLTWVEIGRASCRGRVSVVVVEGLVVWDRSVDRPESPLTLRLPLGAPPALIVPRFQLTVLVMPLWVFLQAADGMRDELVTGFQTCALPISDGPPLWTPSV